jgi:hypothetical protein
VVPGDTIELDDEKFLLNIGRRYEIEEIADTCTVLAKGADGRPVFVQNAYGEGKIFFSLIPLERILSDRAGAFKPHAAPYWKFYKPFAALVDRRAVESPNKAIFTTEHILGDNRRAVVAINFANSEQPFVHELRDGWRVSKLHHGEIGSIPANDAVVFEVTK